MRIKVKKVGQAITTAGSGYKKGDMVRVEPSKGMSHASTSSVDTSIINDPYQLRITASTVFMGKTVEVGYNGIVRSGDGVNWFYLKKMNHNFTAAYASGSDLMVGTTGGLLLVTTNLKNWSVIAQFSDAVSAISSSGVVLANGDMLRLVDNNWLVYGTSPVVDDELISASLGAEVNPGITSTTKLISVVDHRGIQFAVDDSGSLLMSHNDGYWFVSNTTTKFKQLANNSDLIIGVTNSGAITKTVDGVEWSTPEPIDGTASILGVNYSDGRFVAYGADQTLLVSTDGIQWTVLDFEYSFLDVVSNADASQFLGLLHDGNCAKSTDGINWVLIPDPIIDFVTKVLFVSGKFCLLGSGMEASSSVDLATFQRVTIPLESEVVDAASNGTTVVLIDGNTVITSDDFDTFTKTSLDISPNQIKVANSKFVIFTNLNSRVFHSDDGLNWGETQIYASGTTDEIQSVVFFDNKFTFVTTTGHLYQSTDGEYFTKIGETENRLLVVADTHVIGYSNGSIHSTVDFVSWTTVAQSIGHVATLKKVNNLYFALGDTLTQSNDGFAWVGQKRDDWDFAAYGNDCFVVASKSGRMAYSDDDIQWRATGINKQINNLQYVRDAFYAVGDGFFAKSTDGVVWTITNVGVEGAPSSYVAFSKSSTTSMIHTVAGAATNVLVSSDEINWSVKTTIAVETVRVVNGAYYGISVIGRKVVKSIDGIKWDEVSTFSNVTLLLSANSTLMALSDAGDYVCYTEEGANWINVPVGNPKLTMLAYSGDYYGSDGTKLYKSTDAINWIEEPKTGEIIGFKSFVNAIGPNVPLTIAVGDGFCWSTVDHITWSFSLVPELAGITKVTSFDRYIVAYNRTKAYSFLGYPDNVTSWKHEPWITADYPVNTLIVDQFNEALTALCDGGVIRYALIGNGSAWSRTFSSEETGTTFAFTDGGPFWMGSIYRGTFVLGGDRLIRIHNNTDYPEIDVLYYPPAANMHGANSNHAIDDTGQLIRFEILNEVLNGYLNETELRVKTVTEVPRNPNWKIFTLHDDEKIICSDGVDSYSLTVGTLGSDIDTATWVKDYSFEPTMGVWPIGDGKYLEVHKNGKFRTFTTSEVTYDSFLGDFEPVQGTITHIACTANSLFALRNQVSNNVLYEVTTASRAKIKKPEVFDGITANGQMMVAWSSGPGGSIKVTTDGVTWATTNITNVNKVIHTNGLWVAVTENLECYTSPDTITWTKMEGVVELDYDLTFLTTFVAFKGKYRKTSADLVAIKFGMVCETPFTVITSAEYGSDVIAAGGGIATSQDGAFWDIDASAVSGIKKIVVGETTNAFVTTSNVYTGSVGEWTLLPANIPGDLVSVALCFDSIVAMTRDSTITINLQNWLDVTVFGFTNANSIAASPSKLVMACGDNNIIHFAEANTTGVTSTVGGFPDNIKFSDASYYGGNYYFTEHDGSVRRLITSPNLFQFNITNLALTDDSDISTYSVSDYLVVIDGNNFNISDNGLDWTKTTLTKPNGRLVASNNMLVGVNVTVDVQNKTIKTNTSPVEAKFNSFVHGDRLYAYGEHGIVLTSVNGGDDWNYYQNAKVVDAVYSPTAGYAFLSADSRLFWGSLDKVTTTQTARELSGVAGDALNVIVVGGFTSATMNGGVWGNTLVYEKQLTTVMPTTSGFLVGGVDGYIATVNGANIQKAVTNTTLAVQRFKKEENKYFALYGTKIQILSNAIDSVATHVWVDLQIEPLTALNINAVAVKWPVVVVVGDDGKSLIRNHRRIWLDPETNTTEDMTSVVYVGDRFVVCGSNGYIGFVNQEYEFENTTAGTASRLNALRLVGDSVYVMGDGFFAKSADYGSTWSPIQLRGTKMHGASNVIVNESLMAAVVVGNNLTLVGGGSFVGNFNTQTTEFNYVRLSKAKLDFVVPIGNRFIAYSSANYAMASSDCITWYIDSSFYHPGPDVTTFAWSSVANQKVVGVGPIPDGKTSPVIRSTSNGINWTTRTSPIDRNLNRVVYGDSGYVAVGEGATIIKSIDGITWTAVRSDLLSDIKFSNSLKVYAVVGGDGFAGYLPSGNTTDWVSGWESGFTDRDYNFKSLISVGSKFIAVAEGGRVMYTNSGSVWGVTATDTNVDIKSVAAAEIDGKSLYVAVGDAGKILTSPDCLVFTSRASGITSDLNSIIYDGEFIVVGDNGTISTSSSTMNWKSRASNTTMNLNQIVKAGSSYIAVGDNGTIVTSTNKETWRVRSSGTTKHLFAVGVIGNTVFAVGEAGTILKASVSLLGDWEKVELPITDDLTSVVYAVESSTRKVSHVFGKSKTHYTSTDDGVTWVDATTNYTKVWFTNGQYIAANTTNPNSAAITSTNGVDWHNSAQTEFVYPLMVNGNTSIRYKDDLSATRVKVKRGIPARITSVNEEGGALSIDLFKNAVSNSFSGIMSDKPFTVANGTPEDLLILPPHQTNKYEGRIRKLNLSNNAITTVPSGSNPMHGQIGNKFASVTEYSIVRTLLGGISGNPLTSPSGSTAIGDYNQYLGGALGMVNCHTGFKNQHMAATKYEIRNNVTGAIEESVVADIGYLSKGGPVDSFNAIFVEHTDTTSIVKFYFKQNASTLWAHIHTMNVDNLLGINAIDGAMCVMVTNEGVLVYSADTAVGPLFEDIKIYNAGDLLPFAHAGKDYFVRPCLADFGQYANVELFDGIYFVMQAEVFENVGGAVSPSGNNYGAMPVAFDVSSGTMVPTLCVFAELNVARGVDKIGERSGVSFYKNQPKFYSFTSNYDVIVAAAKVTNQPNLVDVYSFAYNFTEKRVKLVSINRVDTVVETFSPVIVPKVGKKYALTATTVLGNGIVQVYDATTGALTNSTVGNNRDFGKCIAFNADGSSLFIGDPMFNNTATGSGGVSNFIWSIYNMNPEFRGEGINTLTLTFSGGDALEQCPDITTVGVGNVGHITEMWPYWTPAGGGQYLHPSELVVDVKAIS